MCNIKTNALTLYFQTLLYCNISIAVELRRDKFTMSLTSACCVHSNVYGLVNIHWIRYLTAVDPIHSTSSTMQKYHHRLSVSVEIPLCCIDTLVGNSSCIGKEPVPYGRPVFTSMLLATSSEVSHTEQSIALYTNVLQGYDTVVQICFIIEWELNITCTQKVRKNNVIIDLWGQSSYVIKLHNYSGRRSLFTQKTS